jgi:hypothetical protein
MLFTLLMLVSSVSYSQVFHARAYGFIFGEMKAEGFSKTSESEVDILVRGENKSITIYSKNIQEYKVVSYNGELNSGLDVWTVIDRDGDICFLKIMKLENDDIVIVIEYSDVAWMYLCKLEN